MAHSVNSSANAEHFYMENVWTSLHGISINNSFQLSNCTTFKVIEAENEGRLYLDEALVYANIHFSTQDEVLLL